MAGTTLFISDLHLCGERPAITALFLDFLAGDARNADALYILGDLFEYWLGDEAASQPAHQPIMDGLRAASVHTPIYVMHGNRDFLMGVGFERASGCRLIPDPTRTELYGTPVLLMHGDSLCTADAEHMAFRATVRDEKWQREFLAKPVAEREAIAREYRAYSKMATAKKNPEIMDVTPEAVEAVMRQHYVLRLIHGHTHRPREHALTIDGKAAKRAVLGDWYEQGSVLRVSAKGWSLETLPLRTVRESAG
jgi:UDP-2,3-diacylglucosamine hydrolase